MSVPFLTYTPASSMQSGLNAATRDSSRAIEAELASALRRLQLQMNVVDDFERCHGINECWVSSDPWYIQAREYCSQRCFTQVIEKLEELVIQHLFELSKANLVQMHKHISKAITWQSGAIRTALEKYNTLAPLQVPPQPTLDYTEVVGYTSLGEFALLKHSCHDLLAKPWAIPENQEMAANAWVGFEDKEILSAIDTLDAIDSTLLAAELQTHYARQHRVNNVHRAHLHKISQLSGYTGPPLFLLPEREMSDDRGRW
ncbi:hypothetical protein DFJ58DRAFT_739688 [Suillus subalutaceus]|uniref:uncharacterized protein n=1 Tax=Suillus subalutaceus TaxID=48586 RepID=UPI001B871952|nr:uncharacterized protein DFJ58DRAFT_739688 [Suillus subalutaceus]KAG1816658.1 hypothetical protein DFJ58DRAFT_739688 [Suillus subalutaceus]